ncbi:MAG TPA: carbonic anhydrase [Anaeromyxobacteraceae bacterium]|nr:carbonic anhydrase [Anaeromyxobacteraceae bacterium]
MRLVKTALLAALAAPLLALASDHPGSHPTPDQAIGLLKEGSGRFASGAPRHPDQGLARVKELAAGQAPFATVLSCSDSRVPPELVFDQGLGDLFVVRVAGNVADPVDLGSVEYAAEHLGVPAIVVLGHHQCGAVKATAEAVAAGAKVEGNLGAIVREIAPAVETARKDPGAEGLLNDAAHANAKRTAAALVERSPVIKKLVDEGKVKIVVAVYDLGTGTVEWL